MFTFLSKYIILITIICETKPNIYISDKGVLPLHKGSVGIQLYIVLRNQCMHPCNVNAWSKKCCLISNNNEHCDVFEAVGGDMGTLGPGENRKIIFVYPNIYQLNKQGYCFVVIQHKCENINKRHHLKLDFNTNVFNKKKNLNKLLKEYKSDKIKFCDAVDRDPFNACLPVNCEWKYNGLRPYYDKYSDECVEAPSCADEASIDLPAVVYVREANKCKMVANPLSVEEAAVIKKKRFNKIKYNNDISTKDDVLNGMTISQNIELLRDMLYGDLDHECKQKTISAFIAIMVSIIIVVAMLFSLVFCLNGFILLFKRWSKSKEQESRRRKRKEEEVNMLLKDVIIRDIPLELRSSVIDACDRMSREMRKRRYRSEDLLNISLEEFESDVDEGLNFINEH